MLTPQSPPRVVMRAGSCSRMIDRAASSWRSTAVLASTPSRSSSPGVIEIYRDEGSRSGVLGENGLEDFGAHRVAAAGDVEGELGCEGADARATGALPLGPHEAKVLSSRGHHEVSFPPPTAIDVNYFAIQPIS